MSIEFVGELNAVWTITLRGVLSQAELNDFKRAARTRLEQSSGKVGVLIVATEFQGWAKGGDWGDLEQQFMVDPFIRKMAIVGDKRWEDLSALFTAKGFRDFPIEYFPPGQIADAVAWLEGADT